VSPEACLECKARSIENEVESKICSYDEEAGLA